MVRGKRETELSRGLFMLRPGAVIVFVTMVLEATASSREPSFSRVETYPEMGRLDYILAVADFNDDGLDDMLAGGREEAVLDGQPEDRHDTTALAVFFGQEDGTFEHAPDLIDGTIEAWQPIVVAADFNNDEQIDLAVFDAGVFVGEESVGYGNPPQLWLSDDDGVLRSSDSLSDAVTAEHALRPPGGKGLSAPADLHIKSAAAGDIDNDGDLDLWVESTGGKNVNSHFMVNNGDETFTIERDRATDAVFRNDPPDHWRHVGHTFLDIDNDGDPDLALGTIRRSFPAFETAVSIVVVNDGTGHYPERIGLPRVDFNEGYTSIRFVTHFDFNADGFEDLLLVHARNSRPMGPPAFTGRHLQALINDGGESFVDETPTWLGDQSLTEQVYYPNGDLVYGDANPRMLDIDRDGCEDIVMANSNTLIRPESPIFYLNNGSGQFQPVDPDEMFTGMDWSGIYGVPADVNGDDVIDLVFPQRVVGPDDEYGTEDDSTRFLTLLNTTPPSPVRCEEPDESDGTI
ncbi:MAG: VCBS repeat-containing protein [Acidobacteria bacterium]|nr:VCBS repeat-containing protein [Acidobacteriota bacterium]